MKLLSVLAVGLVIAGQSERATAAVVDPAATAAAVHRIAAEGAVGDGQRAAVVDTAPGRETTRIIAEGGVADDRRARVVDAAAEPLCGQRRKKSYVGADGGVRDCQCAGIEDAAALVDMDYAAHAFYTVAADQTLGEHQCATVVDTAAAVSHVTSVV